MVILFAGYDSARPIELLDQEEPRHFMRYSKFA